MLRLIKSLRCILATIVTVIAFSSNDLAAAAEPLSNWSLPERVPGYARETQPPYLVADRNRTVHAFTSQLVQNTVAVVYSKWTREGGWTNPTDVLLPPDGGEAAVVGTFLDDNNTIHVAFFAQNEQSASIFYSSAPLSDAGRAHSWTAAKLVGSNAGPARFAALVGNGRGNLFIIYSGNRQGYGVYATESHDSGATWSEPIPIFLTYSTYRQAAQIQAYMDSKNRVHAVWTLAHDSGNGEGVYYARLEEDIASWTWRATLAGPSLGGNSPSIIGQDNLMMVTYLEGSQPTRWMRTSGDGGNNWSVPIQLFANFDTNSSTATLLHDAADILHLILGNRSKNLATLSIWHSAWDGDSWGDLEAVVSGPKVRSSQPSVGLDTTGPRAVICQGNILLAAWVNYEAAGADGVWYSYTILNAPQLPVAPLPTPTLDSLSPPRATRIPSALRLAKQERENTPTSSPPRPLRSLADEPIPATQTRELPWMFSVAPAVLLISAVVALQLRRKHS